MHKMFLSAAALTLMVHGAVACEVNRQAGPPVWAIALPDDCNGSDCRLSPPQDQLNLPADDKSAPNPARDCGVPYFDPGIYSGSAGLRDWLVASLDAQSQYKAAGEGFVRSPMDANAQYR
jgi:hypothetical protein